MKRLRIITNPTKVADMRDVESQDLNDKWLLKAEKIRIKRMRNFRQNLTAW